MSLKVGTNSNNAPIIAEKQLNSTLPQKSAIVADDNKKKTEEISSENKLWLTLGALAVLGTGIYFACRGKGNAANKAASTASETLSNVGSKMSESVGASGAEVAAESVAPSISRQDKIAELRSKLTHKKMAAKRLVKQKAAENLEKHLTDIKDLSFDKNGIAKQGDKLFTGKIRDKYGYRRYKNGVLQSYMSDNGKVTRLVKRNPNHEKIAGIRYPKDFIYDNEFYEVEKIGKSRHFIKKGNRNVEKIIRPDGSYKIIEKDIERGTTHITEFDKNNTLLRDVSVERYSNGPNPAIDIDCDIDARIYNKKGELVKHVSEHQVLIQDKTHPYDPHYGYFRPYHDSDDYKRAIGRYRMHMPDKSCIESRTVSELSPKTGKFVTTEYGFGLQNPTVVSD